MNLKPRIGAHIFFALAFLVCWSFDLHAEDRPPEEVLNVDFNGTDSGELSPTFAGVSPIGGGVFWNGLNASGASVNGKVWTGLMQSDGDTPSDVQISQQGFTGVMTMKFEKDGTTPTPFSENSLLVDMISTVRGAPPAELWITGLRPNTSYDLALFGRGTNIGTRFTVDGMVLETTGSGPGDLPMQADRDYVTFSSISSGDKGEIIVNVEGTGSGAHLSGLSLAPSK